MSDVEQIPVIWRRHSFAEPTRESRPAGMTVAEIVHSLPELPARFWEDGVVTVADQTVPREMWDHVRPKARTDGSVDVALWLAPQGGNTLRVVATIAILVGAALISGGALATPAAFGGLFAAGSLTATALAASVTRSGGLALSALSQVKS